MMYPYMTFPDNTEVCHSQLLENGTLVVHFERPTEHGFDSARCRLPDYVWISREGYSTEEIKAFEDFLKANAHLFFKFAQSGGISCA